jgi:hypothetical protein
MPMPETAMHEYRKAMPRQYDIRTARKVASVKTKSLAKRMERASHHQFRLRILGPHPRHKS